MTISYDPLHGIALIDKPATKTSFYLIKFLRKLTSIKCIGHAGTLDPFATGLMVLLIGKPYTRQSQDMIAFDKEYRAKIKLGISTDTHDLDGKVTFTSDKEIEENDLMNACQKFNGEIMQIPPMFSAKKIKGQKLYNLARKGQVIERSPKKIKVDLEVLNYNYPYVDVNISCSSGTYIRTIADDLGNALGCGAHLVELRRTRVGPYKIEECQTLSELSSPDKLNLTKKISL